MSALALFGLATILTAFCTLPAGRLMTPGTDDSATRLANDFASSRFHVGPRTQREVGVCSVTTAPEDERYLDWIPYHLALGFTRFFIYGTDGSQTAEEIQPLVDAGVVWFADISAGKSLQHSCCA